MAKAERCGDCLFWDHRAEAEVDEHTGYCTVHEMMKGDGSWCDQFQRRTPEAVRRYYNDLYSDGSDYEESVDMEDLEF